MLVPLAALALAGCDDATDESTTASSTTTSSTQQATPPDDTTTSANKPKPKPDAPQLYFTAGEQFEKVLFDAPSGDAQKQAEAATQALIDGPPEGGHTVTQLPPDTELDGVEVAGDGTATVDVSAEFLDGVPAQAAQRDDAQRQEIAARLG